ncbi:hypothetical protein NDU88_004233 [Pleurodeles waltl]|uniref:Uncharacterized protein n=1 Tax=Pleurodeles waltl TaxID=8319 RepID=A0AAV7QEV4_PLEWA|nr:hypothetical protein NDU88_004233 [Pleurodeles waltl]
MAGERLQRSFVKSEALSQLRPVRKAVEGVAAAVWACSPPRRGRGWEEQVRCGRCWARGGVAQLVLGARCGSLLVEDTARKTRCVEGIVVVWGET